MSVLDFLFQGEPPPQVETFSSTSANLPDWYQAYLRGNIAKASEVAGEEFQPFTGPRVAEFTPSETRAYADLRAGLGAERPTYDAAGNLIRSGGAADSAAAAEPLIQGALSRSPTGAAQPYLDRAGATFPGAVDQYLDPFRFQVTDRIAELGNRNLLENILPQVQDQFIAGGQAGSARQDEFTSRAIRDTANEIAGQQAGALSQGYQTAGQLFGADQARLAGIGATTGQLTGDEQRTLGTLAQLRGQLTSDTAGRQLEAGEQLGALAGRTQQARLQDSAALEAAGRAEREFFQRNLDEARSAFEEERDFPRENVRFLNEALRGLQPPTSSTTSSLGPASSVGASPLSQLVGGGLSIAALKKAGVFKRGGRVKKRRPMRGALAYV